MKKEAYVVIDKKLGCRVLRFSPEGSFITNVIVEKTDEELYHQFSGGVSEGDILFSIENKENYKLIKIK